MQFAVRGKSAGEMDFLPFLDLRAMTYDTFATLLAPKHCVPNSLHLHTPITQMSNYYDLCGPVRE